MQHEMITLEEAVQHWLNGRVVECRDPYPSVPYSIPRGWEPIYPGEGGYFSRSCQYRIRSSPTIFINGVELEAPLSIEDIEHGDTYWFVEMDGVAHAVWCDSDVDFKRCRQKRCFSTESDAEQCRDALVRAALGGEPDKTICSEKP